MEVLVSLEVESGQPELSLWFWRWPRPQERYAVPGCACIYSGRDSIGSWCCAATTVIAVSPTRIPPTCSQVSGCPRMTQAATAATSGFRQLIADEIDAST